MNDLIRLVAISCLACSACGGVGFSCLELQASRPTFRIAADLAPAEDQVFVRPVAIAEDVSRPSDAQSTECSSPAQCFDAIGMELYRTEGGVYGDYVMVDGGDTFELVDRDVMPGRTYQYRMGLVRLLGDEDPSPVVTDVSLAVEVATAPDQR